MNVVASSKPSNEERASTVLEFNNYIGGKLIGGRKNVFFDDVNPADTSDVVARFAASSAEDATSAVEAAARAFAGWKRTPISARAKILNRAADYLEAHVDQFAMELTREQGKALNLSKDEILRSAQTLRFYAVEGHSFTGETFPNDDLAMEVYSLREPLGVVTVITPWNFPISIPARKIAPALIMGNTVVFKPSSDAPLSGYRLVEAFAAAGIPDGVLNFITGPATEIAPSIVGPDIIRAISFTGSTSAGEHIHRSVPFTTRVQLELGGKNPLVIMEDADLDIAVDLTIRGGLALTGQVCTGTSRVIIMNSVKAEYTERLVAKIKKLKIGAGTTSGTDIGPLTTEKQLKTVLRYVAIGKSEATHVYGGDRLTSSDYAHGFFILPAVFTDVSSDMRIAREEIFGPVIAIIEATSYADAIAKANDTEFGLSAAIATNNPRYMHQFSRDIEAGTVKVNRTTSGNLLNAPFGGLKRSSSSNFRESGRTGLEFYTQIKTVYRAY